MARAGYDPRDLANMFRTIKQQHGGSGGPEWLSSHPDPGNRYQRIMQEAQGLRSVRGQTRDNSAEFNRVQASLRRMAPAPTLEEIARNRQPLMNERNYPAGSRIEARVEAPAGRSRTYRAGREFQLSVPNNWQEFAGQDSVTFAPRGAYGNYQGQTVFTHGSVAGVANVSARNLQQASEQYVNALLNQNPYLQTQSNFRRGRIAGRAALSSRLAGTSPVTGQTEVVTVHTTMLRSGMLFYLINVAPRAEFQAYDRVFAGILNSVVLNG